MKQLGLFIGVFTPVWLPLLVMSLVGCPSKTVEVIGEGTIEPKPQLPQCVKVYAGGPARQFWKAIKTPIPEGEEHPDGISNQRYVYELCGTPFGGRPLGHPWAKDSICDVSGEKVTGVLYRLGPQGRVTSFIDVVEVSEHCRDEPIDGACKTGYNCKEFFERTPYPVTCGTSLEGLNARRLLGTCSAMWGTK